MDLSIEKTDLLRIDRRRECRHHDHANKIGNTLTTRHGARVSSRASFLSRVAVCQSRKRTPPGYSESFPAKATVEDGTNKFDIFWSTDKRAST